VAYYPYYISIDFGTSNTSVAYWDGVSENYELSRLLSTDAYKMPSSVYCNLDGLFEFGDIVSEKIGDWKTIEDESERRSVQNRLILSPKKYIKHVEIPPISPSENVKVVDLISSFFLYLKEGLEDKDLDDQIVQKVVLTHPVSFSQEECSNLVNAAIKGGFKVVELIPEPVAAAYGYNGYGKNLVVVDLGGGTLDLAFVSKISNGELQVLDTDGDPDLGGNKFDEDLYDYLLKHCGIKAKVNKLLGNSDFKDLEILNECRIYKEGFSRKIAAGEEKYRKTILLSEDKGGMIKFDLNKFEFEKAIEETVETIITKVSSFIKRGKKKFGDIDNVILTGGASLLPSFQEKLNNALDIKVLLQKDYDTAVVSGACIYANSFLFSDNDLKENQQQIFESIKGKVEHNEDREAFNSLVELANRGFPPAMHELGVAYNKGLIVKKNINEAARWFNRCLELEHLSSLPELALIYLLDKNTITEGYSLLKSAVEKGNQHATFQLGLCYLYGKGVQLNLESAKDCFIKALDHDYHDALIYYILTQGKAIFQNNPNFIFKDNFSSHLYSDLIEIVSNVYDVSMHEIVFIHGHRTGGRYHKSGAIVTTGGVAWNSSDYKKDPVFLKWEMAYLQKQKSNSVSLRSIPLSSDNSIYMKFTNFVEDCADFIYNHNLK